ncbi:hypothetical protein Angca_006262 [Angiostrongylus cantonensis]|nr:hypothetical protein Angca_006262 [Angiostrongylus cantonensis]
MLDSLGGKQTSSWLDGLSSTVNINSSVSSGLNHSQTNNSEALSRPSWLFNSQSIHDSLSSPTEALSSLLDTLSSPVLDSCSTFSIGQFSGSPYKQMTSPNRFAQPNRRAVGIMSSHYESNNSPGAPGTPINNSSMASVNFNPSGGVTTLSNVPPPKNPKLYKTELCRSWMDHGRCNYGERCQYAHGEQEKRPIPRHPKYKTEACQSYHQSGYCPYGPRCHFIHSEADLLANLSAPPSSVRTNRNSGFLPQPSSQQLSSTSFAGAPLSNPVMSTRDNILRSSVLQRVSSLPGYGSTGESTAGSSSSVDSGSESPNGSFSPGLDLDDGGTFVTAFMATRQISQRGQQMSNLLNYDMNRTRADPMINRLIADTMSLTCEDKWERTPGRLPVFAQLSNPQ